MPATLSPDGASVARATTPEVKPSLVEAYRREHSRGLYDQSLCGVVATARQVRELAAGLAGTWLFFVLAAGLSVLAHWRARSRGPVEPVDRWVLASLAVGLLVRVVQLNHHQSWLEDEGLYGHALITAVESGTPTHLPYMTGSLFAWPPVMLLLARLGGALGVGGWVLARFVTSVLSLGSAYFCYRLARLLAARWAGTTGLSPGVLGRAARFAALLPALSAAPLLDSLYATYNPLAACFLMGGLYHLARGAYEEDPLFCWAGGALVTASFVTRYFPVLALAPVVVLLTLAMTRRGLWASRRLLAHSLLATGVFALLLVAPIWDEVLAGIRHARWLSDESLFPLHVGRAAVARMVAVDLALTAPLVLGGAFVLLARAWRRGAPGWETLVLLAGWLVVPGYSLAKGHIFSLDKNLALTVFIGAPLAAVGLAVLLDSRAWLRRRVPAAVVLGATLAAVLVPGIHVARGQLPKTSSTTDVRDWFLTYVTLPDRPTALVNLGADSNPWSLKLELENRGGNGLRVLSVTAFRGESRGEMFDLQADIYHLVVPGLSPDFVAAKRARGFQVCAVPPDEPDRLNVLLLRADIHVRPDAPGCADGRGHE